MGTIKISSEQVARRISCMLGISPEMIYNIYDIKAGMTNQSFAFTVDNKKYILRTPCKETKDLINRDHEYSVYKALGMHGVSDEVIYFNTKTGEKITTFIEEAHTLDIHNHNELNLCMQRLKEFHNLHISVSHTFDLRERLVYYESLRGQVSAYADYDETRQHVLGLLSYIESLPIEYTLCHIDAVCDNFLIDKHCTVYIIDFEYAGMQDPDLDIAMFCVYSGLSRHEVDRIISLYHGCHVSRELVYKIYSYIAIAGLIWSNWCEVKEGLAVRTNRYALSQYNCAKQFYHIVRSEFLMK